MVHAVTLRGDGTAAYCSRWVATERLAQEQRIGAPLAVKSELEFFLVLHGL
jgi:carotenoid cleavage dioxygenase-like enzyme